MVTSLMSLTSPGLVDFRVAPGIGVIEHYSREALTILPTLASSPGLAASANCVRKAVLSVIVRLEALNSGS